MNSNGIPKKTKPVHKVSVSPEILPFLPVSKETDRIVLEYLLRRERSSDRASAKASHPVPKNWLALNAIFDFAVDVAAFDPKKLFYLW